MQTPLLEKADGGNLRESTSSLGHIPSLSKVALKRSVTAVDKDAARVNKKLGSNSSLSAKKKSFLSLPACRDIFPPDAPGVIANIVAGLSAGIKVSISGAVYAALMWTQTAALAPKLALGLKMNYFTGGLLCFVYFVIGGIPFGMVLVQDIPALLLGKMGHDLAIKLEDTPELLVPSFVALIATQAIFTGFIFLLFSSLNYTALVQQVPHAVVGGFVAACGAGLWRAAMSTLTNVKWASNGFWPTDYHVVLEPANIGLLCAGWAQFFLMLKGPPFINRKVNNKYVKSLAGPLCTLATIPLFYLILKLCGLSAEDARAAKWLNPAHAQSHEPFWSYWAIAYDFEHISFTAIMSFAPQMLACAMLALLEAVFNCASVDNIMDDGGPPLDTEREVASFGIANLVCGLAGANMGYLQGSTTLNAKLVDKATHKLSIGIAGSFAMMLFMSGLPLADYIPKFTMGAVFLLVGWFFLSKWLFYSRSYLPTMEYLAVWVITIVSIVKDIDMALITGMIISAGIYIGQSSTLKPVKSVTRADMTHSKFTKRRRLPDEVKFLSEQGHQIAIITCSGFLFWASARAVGDSIQQLMQNQTTTVRWLLIDLKYVPRLDISAVKAFEKSLRIAKQKKCHIGFCNADKYSASLLKDSKLIDPPVGWYKVGAADRTNGDQAMCDYFESVDVGLQWFEDELLRERSCVECQLPTELQDTAALRELIKDFYAKFSDWSGVFVINSIVEIFVNTSAEESAAVSARYAFAKVSTPDVTEGHDFRRFQLERKAGGWAVTSIGDRGSGRRSSAERMDLPEDVVEKLGAMQETDYKKHTAGDTVISIGSEFALYVLITGSLGVAQTMDGEKVEEERMDVRAGALVGSLDFALRRPATVEMVALEDTEVLHVSKEAMALLRQKDTPTYVLVQDCLMKRLKDEYASSVREG